MIKISKLTYDKTVGSGCKIKAHIDKEVNCVEFTMKGNHDQKVLIACEPWIQFPNGEWDDMIDSLFTELVNLWNEKHYKERSAS